MAPLRSRTTGPATLARTCLDGTISGARRRRNRCPDGYCDSLLFTEPASVGVVPPRASSPAGARARCDSTRTQGSFLISPRKT